MDVLEKPIPPSMEDYGINEESIAEYERQVNNEKKLRNQYDEEVNKKTRIVLLLIPSIILFFSIIAIIADKDPGKALGFWLLSSCILDLLVAVFAFSENASWRMDEYDRIHRNCINGKLKLQVESYKRAVSEYNYELSYYNEEIKKLKREFWIALNGYEFEKEVAHVFERMGYNARVTPKSGDGGIDIILEKDACRFAVQCKHHSKPVGPSPVRELMGVVASQRFDGGIFVSLNGFSQTVYDEVSNSSIHIQLMTLKTLLNYTHLMTKSSPTESTKGNDKGEKKTIPQKETLSQTPAVNTKGNIGVGDVKIITTSAMLPRRPSVFETDETFVRYCMQFGINENKRYELYAKGFHKEEIIQGIVKANKIREKYPDANLKVCDIIMKSDDEVELLAITSTKNTAIKFCDSNCSTCKRDTCIYDEL
jgi:hypothetical protein